MDRISIPRIRENVERKGKKAGKRAIRKVVAFSGGSNSGCWLLVAADRYEIRAPAPSLATASTLYRFRVVVIPCCIPNLLPSRPPPTL